jgi:hypothetical protein
MNLRYVAVISMAAVTFSAMQAVPASAATLLGPSVQRLEATSSTHVSAGDSVNVAYNFKGVMSRPIVTLFFRKNYGPEEIVRLNVSTDYVVVPATWTAGTYRLHRLVITTADHSSGQHFRDYLHIGTGRDGNLRRSYTRLNLAKLDIHVS